MENNKKNHVIENVMETAAENIKSMVDGNTVVGDPFTAPDGTTIIPISKITVGFASGGSDFASKNTSNLCFGGGSGAGISVTPVSFLVITPDGQVNVLPATQNTVTTADKVMEKVPELIEELKALFKKDQE